MTGNRQRFAWELLQMAFQTLVYNYLYFEFIFRHQLPSNSIPIQTQFLRFWQSIIAFLFCFQVFQCFFKLLLIFPHQNNVNQNQNVWHCNHCLRLGLKSFRIAFLLIMFEDFWSIWIIWQLWRLKLWHSNIDNYDIYIWWPTTKHENQDV